MKCFIEGCGNVVSTEQFIHIHKYDPIISGCWIKPGITFGFEDKDHLLYYACENHRARNRPDLIITWRIK